MLDRRSRHRIHGMLADVVLLELWLANEVQVQGDDDPTAAELADAFSRVQARMLVVQAILWPDDEGPEPDPDGNNADDYDDPHYP